MLPFFLLFFFKKMYLFIIASFKLVLNQRVKKQIDTQSVRNPCVLKIILETVGTATIVNFFKSISRKCEVRSSHM